MQISPHCYALTGLAYLPAWPVNAGFVVGQITTLVVDTGASALPAATIHGYASAVAPSNRIAVLNTEKHFDHTGGNSYFRDRGAEIHGHALIARTQQEFEQERADYNSAIGNSARRNWKEGEVFYRGTALANPAHPIRTDTTLELGGCTVEILLTPGHTPTNVSAWVPADRVLFCGDCLSNGYIANLDFGARSQWRQWLDSLQRIEKLEPQVIVPGHGPIVREGEAPHLIDAVRGELELAIAKGFSRTLISGS